MSDNRIPQFPKGEITPDSIFPIISNGINSQITFSSIINAINAYNIHLTGGTHDSFNGITTFNLNNGDSFDVNGYFHLGYTPENVINKQNSMVYDGTGIKYPTVDTVNPLMNTIATASLNTGFIDATDSFIMTRIDNFTLALSASSKGIIYKSLLQTLPSTPTKAILNIPDTIIPLSNIGLINNGIYIKFIGYDDTGNVVYSDTTFKTSYNVTQLGILILNVTGGITSFLDNTRGIISMPNISNYSNLERTMLTLQSNITVRPNAGTMTINNTSGSIQGMSVNWHGLKNDEKTIISNATSSFIHISKANALTPIIPPFTTTVTTTQYWNGSFLVNLTTGGAATIQRWLVLTNGTLALQYGEKQYPDLNTAVKSISTETFTEILPADTYVEIARMAAINGAIDLSNIDQAVFVVTAGGSANSTNVGFWGDITGSINNQTDLFRTFQIPTDNSFINLGTATTATTTVDLSAKRNYNIVITGNTGFNFVSGPDGTENNLVINMPLTVNPVITFPTNIVWNNSIVVPINNLDGTRDITFNGNIGDGLVNSLVRQPDTKIIAGGSFTQFNSVGSINKIGRFNLDGTSDINFNFKIGSGFNNTVNIITLQPDNKIIVGGLFTTYYNASQNYISRLNSDGSLDTTFNIGSGFNNSVNSICLQTGDSKLLVGGTFTTYSGISANRIVRLNTDGTIDSTFSGSTGFDNAVLWLVQQPDTKILVGGQFNRYNASFSNRIIKLKTNAISDNTFNIGLGFNNTVYTSIVQPSDGKILVGGTFTTYSGISINRIIRLNPDGSIDTSFIVGTGFDNVVYTMAIQSDNKILVGGNFATYNGITSNRLIRLNPNGSYDNSFSIGVNGFNGTVYSIAIQTDNKILVGGSINNFSGITIYNIIRLNTNGTKDNTFNTTSSFDSDVRTMILQPDNKIVCGGNFTIYSGVSFNRIIRLNPDASIDYTFNVGSGLNNYVLSLAQQLDGKILAGGIFYIYSGAPQNSLIRFNTDGSKDTSFNIGAGFNSSINSIVIQSSDSKIVAGGTFATYSGISSNRLVRLNTDGSYDNTFNVGIGFDSDINSIAIQPDNTLFISGNFVSYGGTISNDIIRLNPDGSKDNTFNIGNGFDSGVNIMTIQSDNKILCGGQFSSYSGISSNRLARLNIDGSYDNTFNIGAGFNSTIRTIQIQAPYNRILVGGDFTTVNGIVQSYFARLLPNGNLDISLTSVTNSSVYTILQQPDNNILIGGSFTTYNGVTINRVNRIIPSTENNVFLKIKQEGLNITIK